MQLEKLEKRRSESLNWKLILRKRKQKLKRLQGRPRNKELQQRRQHLPLRMKD